MLKQDVTMEEEMIGEEIGSFEMEPSSQPLTVFEKIVDVLNLAEYLQIRSKDVTTFAYKYLRAYIDRRPDHWNSYTFDSLSVLFSLSTNISDIEKVLNLVGQSLAIRFAIVQHRRVTSRAMAYEYQDLLETNQSFAVTLWRETAIVLACCWSEKKQ